MSMNVETSPIRHPDRSTAPPYARSDTSHSRIFWGNTGEFLLYHLLQKVVNKGTLHLQLPSGRSRSLGKGQPEVDVRVTTQATVWRLLRNPDLAVGEAYMDGTMLISGGGIHDLIELALINLKRTSGPGIMRFNAALRIMLRRLAQHNPVIKAQANVAHHDDLSDTLYDLFLDAGRQSSCAYYTAPDDTLERAQAQKLRHIAAKLLLQPGQRVLDIGS